MLASRHSGSGSWGPDHACVALLALGADPNARDSNGESSAMHAVQDRSPFVWDAFKEAGSNFASTNERGRTALHLLVSERSKGVLERPGATAWQRAQFLIDHGCSPMDEDHVGETPLEESRRKLNAPDWAPLLQAAWEAREVASASKLAEAAPVKPRL